MVSQTLNKTPHKTAQQLLGYIEQHPKLEIMQQLEAQPEVLPALTEMTADSRQVKAGDVFIALQGEQVHGLRFLADVLAKQVSVIIADRPLRANEQALIEQHPYPLVVVAVAHIQLHQGDLAAWFYDYPSRQLKVIGITGTNGKTSTAFYCAQTLTALNQSVAIIGTLGNGIYQPESAASSLQKTQNTTPNAIAVQRLLAEFVEQQVQWCVMEVSSHAICLGRIQAVEFAATALTQVTRDHMDFHPTIEHYQQSKMRLFEEFISQSKVLNLDDRVGCQLIENLSGNNSDENALWGYAQQDENHQSIKVGQTQLRYQLLKLDESGMQAHFRVENATGDLDSSTLNIALIGRFNIENVSCALAILLSQGFALQELCQAAQNITAVSGRMQMVAHAPSVILDFAHTPDALEQVLNAARYHLAEQARLWVVFGCGGDRDKGKRPLMAKVAEQIADKVMLTSDNPRTEQPEAIMTDVMAGFVKPENILQQVDREQAIVQVLNQAKAHDIVVIAGKGHEDYQEIMGTRYPFSDHKVVENWQRSPVKNNIDKS